MLLKKRLRIKIEMHDTKLGIKRFLIKVFDFN
jgi:hypothetical protein